MNVLLEKSFVQKEAKKGGGTWGRLFGQSCDPHVIKKKQQPGQGRRKKGESWFSAFCAWVHSHSELRIIFQHLPSSETSTMLPILQLGKMRLESAQNRGCGHRTK